jgi:hypothetical protein
MWPLSIRPEVPTARNERAPEMHAIEAIGRLLDPVDIGDLDEAAMPMWKLAVVEAQMIIDDHRRGAVSADVAMNDLLVVVRRLLIAATSASSGSESVSLRG